MTRIITCRCGQPVQISDSMAGQRLCCPSCGEILDVPRFAPAAAGAVTDLRPVPRSSAKTVLLVLGGVALLLIVVCGGAIALVVRSVQQVVKQVQTELAKQQGRPLRRRDEDYAQARRKFRTQLLVPAPSPQEYDAGYSPNGQKLAFRCGDLTLSAFVDPAPADGVPRPAVLFLHGGFAFGDGDWEMPQPYRDAGYIVMTPILRGENGQPGSFTMFYDEVDDVLAAAAALAELPYVAKEQIFVSGHSAGGTLAVLAAMASDRFRGAASLSGTMNQTVNNDMAPFDTTKDIEFEMRSPVSFAGSFKCPARLYYGTEEFLLAVSTRQTATAARDRGLDVAAEVSPGDHFTSVPASIAKSIAFFNELRAKPANAR